MCGNPSDATANFPKGNFISEWFQVALYFHSLSDKAYETLLLLVQGNFNVPVAERTREQTNAVVRFWRQRDTLHRGPQSTPTLYFGGKKVVKKSSIGSLVATLCDQVKAVGCKKNCKIEPQRASQV